MDTVTPAVQALAAQDMPDNFASGPEITALFTSLQQVIDASNAADQFALFSQPISYRDKSSSEFWARRYAENDVAGYTTVKSGIWATAQKRRNFWLISSCSSLNWNLSYDRARLLDGYHGQPIPDAVEATAKEDYFAGGGMWHMISVGFHQRQVSNPDK
jgi:hypothetical protein